MPRLTNAVPKYRKHKASGQAVVTIDGKDHDLGPSRSKASRIEYDLLIGEWVHNGRSLPHSLHSITVIELINAYRKHPEAYYLKNEQSTGTAENMRPVMRLLRRAYGAIPTSACA